LDGISWNEGIYHEEGPSDTMHFHEVLILGKVLRFAGQRGGNLFHVTQTAG